LILQGHGGFVLGRLSIGLETTKIGERTLVLATKAGFVAAEEGESLILRERLEGEGDADDFVDVSTIVGDVVLLIVHLEVDQGRFDGLDAAQPPAIAHDLEDEIEFDLVGGLEALDEGIEERIVHGAGLVGEDEGVAGESMLDGVQRRNGFALGSFRSAELSVLAIGIDLSE
jgi:hypothetical protein